MSEIAKHTPGPWEFAAPTMAGSERTVIEAYGFGSVAVVSLNGAPKHQDRLPTGSPYHQPQTATMEANARLIKAAPELLKALKATTQALTQERDIIYQSVTDADGNVPDPADGEELNAMNTVIDQANKIIAEVENG